METYFLIYFVFATQLPFLPVAFIHKRYDHWCLMSSRTKHKDILHQQSQWQSPYLLGAECGKSHNVLSASNNNTTERARSQVLGKVQPLWFCLCIFKLNHNLYVKGHGCQSLSENTEEPQKRYPEWAAAQQVFSGDKTGLAAAYPHPLPGAGPASQLLPLRCATYNNRVWHCVIKHKRN